MFIIFLRFSENKANAANVMDEHNAWLKQGFADGVFLLAGSLQANQGGGIVAHNTTQSDLQERLKKDPFVENNVVKAEITQISPAVCDERLNFLMP